MSVVFKQLDQKARTLVGWPQCMCDASDYRHVRWEGPVQWVEPTGVMVPAKTRKWCRHRQLTRALVKAYRQGRAAARREA